MASAYMHGWISLPSMGEMFVEHGVPIAARVDGGDIVDVERLIDEVAELSGLHVTVGPWQPADEAGDLEASLHVGAAEIGEVMRRLAQASAETFYDRYHKRIDAGDTDFDDEAYAHDFHVALSVCGLRWGEVDQPALRTAYRAALHQAADEMVRRPH